MLGINNVAADALPTLVGYVMTMLIMMFIMINCKITSAMKHYPYYVMNWKRFPHYWPFVRNLQRIALQLFDVFFDVRKLLRGCLLILAWWRHQMEIFSALLAICAGNSPVTGEFPTQRPVTRSFDVYFDLRPNERLSKQWCGWWFETLSRSLWRHRNGRIGADVQCNAIHV